MNLDEHQKQFIKLMQGPDYRHSNTFGDFCEMAALTFRQGPGNAHEALRDADWPGREKRYLEIAKQYEQKELDAFAQMLSCIVLSFEPVPGQVHFHDVLGVIFAEMQSNRGKGKWDSDLCLTPWNVALCMAQMTMCNIQIPACGFITVGEPAVGAGVMMIAAAAALVEQNLNPQEVMHITAIDIRQVCFHMAYIQLSLLGLAAIVMRGDSLANQYWDVWPTPAHVLGLWDYKLRARQRSMPAEPLALPEAKPEPEPEPLNKRIVPGQLQLFVPNTGQKGTHASTPTPAVPRQRSSRRRASGA